MNGKRVSTRLAVVFAAAALAGCTNAEQTLGPDATIEHVALRLSEGHPAVLWQALPASYQDDVSGLVHEFSGKMNRDLWNKTFGVVAKFTRLLREKRHLILEHPLVAQQVADSGSTDTEGDWDGIIGLVDLLATSELADLDKLAKLDIDAFLSGTGERFVREVVALSKLAPEAQSGDYLAVAESLQSIEVTLISEQGDQATVRIDVPGQDPQTETLVRVEGKWIPADLAERWPSQLAEARESLSMMSSEETQQREQAALTQLSLVEGMLDVLLAAETPEQFNAAIGAAMGGMMGLAMEASLNQGMETTAIESATDAGLSISFSTPPGAVDPASAMFPMAINAGLGNFPASQSATSTQTGRSTTSEPQPVDTASIRRRPESRDAPVIPLGEANRFVGRKLRVVAVDGMDVVALLAKADGEVLTFEQPLRSGVMSFKMQKREIESLRLAR